MITHIISECSKLAQKEYKTRDGNCTRNLNSIKRTSCISTILENETCKLLWDFEIQTDHLISARRPDLVIVKKKKKKIEPDE